MNTTVLKECNLFKDGDNYYLRLVYIVEDDAEVAEFIIPKMDLGFNSRVAPMLSHGYDATHTLTIGNNEFRLCAGEGHDGANNMYLTKKVIETKTKKMTVAEIEKKLGYKVEIVAEGSKKWHE